MKLAKYLFVVALLVVPFTAQLHAQTLAGAAGGSSALWLEAGQGAANSLGCVWTDKNNTGVGGLSGSGTSEYVTDVRSGAGSANDYGKIWVAWTNTGGGTGCTAPTAAAAVYVYMSLDSGIGNRCLFAQPQCTIHTTMVAGAAGANALAGFTDTPLPANVLSAFNGASINIAGTDVMPYDALFATYQALSPCGVLGSGTQYQGYGRGTWPGPGLTIQAQDNSAIFNVIGFNLSGSDPFTGTPIPAYTVTPVAATPVLVIVNTGNATGFGSASITNIPRATLALYFNDILVRTQDAIPQAFGGLTNANYAGITAWHRESLSGTYNTFDRAITNNKEIYRNQEDAGYPSSGLPCPATEPLSYGRTIAFGGTPTTSNNYRAIGTGDEILQVESTNDSIGYAFWSAANFKGTPYGSGTAGALKYLQVDGVDPLCTTYGCGGSPGEIPTSTNSLLPNVSLPNIVNGSYPIWSEQRFVTTNSLALGYAQTLAGWLATYDSWTPTCTTTCGTQPDFVLTADLNVIHAHFGPLPGIADYYNLVSEGSRVCGAGGPPESGGDAGGIVTSLQAGADYAVLKSNYNTSTCTGITNAAAFGVRQ
jgi:ABC-type phosphate transport system substrate-binding protein